MENRDRIRDQGVSDRPPGTPTPGEEGGDHPDKRRVREEDERSGERPPPRREPDRNQTPKMA